MGTTTTTRVTPGRSADPQRPEETGARPGASRLESNPMRLVRVSIIVPTYCEADNLRPLCERVFAATRAAGIDAELIVVDDDSPDATADVIAEL
ncbi:MAG: glycosyltransferase, partial [Phycisphaerales bacterium]|nr:glycosyltransferase [Phycisphaerales bacterium]